MDGQLSITAGASESARLLREQSCRWLAKRVRCAQGPKRASPQLRKPAAQALRCSSGGSRQAPGARSPGPARRSSRTAAESAPGGGAVSLGQPPSVHVND